jgi:hypothetical protein
LWVIEKRIYRGVEKSMGKNKSLLKQNAQRSRIDAALYGVGGLFLIIAAIVLFNNRGQAASHPAPRANADEIALQNPERYADAPKIAETYKMAADVRSTIDGLFCYCYCKDGHGHYSLLDCFRDDHGAGCDICLESVRIAHKMTQDGKTLEQVRAQIDAQFGRS